MRELDKHLEVNTSYELERYIAELKADQRSKSREKFFQFLLILIGIFGFLYVINSAITGPSSKIKSNKTSVLTSNRYDSPPTPQNGSLVVYTADKSNAEHQHTIIRTRYQHVSIDGAREANEPLQFTIERYNDQADYVLNLGNGLVKKVASKTFSYSYPTAGDYYVKLDVNFKNQSATIFEDRISIAKAIEVPAGVMEIDN
ncbi:MAG: PKD domain-containing protein [Saprospiraceae bacterium]